MPYTPQQITRLEILVQRMQSALAKPDLSPERRAAAERVLTGTQAMLVRRRAHLEDPEEIEFEMADDEEPRSLAQHELARIASMEAQEARKEPERWVLNPSKTGK